MSGFAAQAEEIFRAAESSGSPSDLTILLGDSGLRLIAGSDWPLDSLLRHHGAKTAYRVTERRGHIRVEGRQGAAHCVIESARPAQVARMLLDGSSSRGTSISFDHVSDPKVYRIG